MSDAGASVLPPPEHVGTLLLLRTAPMAGVRAALEQLRALYPRARCAVLGSGLSAPLFTGMDRFQVEGWLTPRSYGSVRARVEHSSFDLTVLCLNGDFLAGYAGASSVMKLLPARAKVVRAASGAYRTWRHADFTGGKSLARGPVNALVAALYPAVALYLLARPTTPRLASHGADAPEPAP